MKLNNILFLILLLSIVLLVSIVLIMSVDEVETTPVATPVVS